VYSLIQRSSKNEQNLLTIPLIAVIGFQLIYETVVATLALTHILPPDALVCGLGDKWMKLVAANDGDAVRAIQVILFLYECAIFFLWAPSLEAP